MNDELCDTVSSVLFISFALAVVFVFHGEPDLWDKWHAQAMQSGSCTKAATPPSASRGAP